MFTEIMPWINYRVLAIIPGLFLGLLGYRLHRISLFFPGFMAGFSISTYIQVDNGSLSIALGILSGLAFGIAGIVFSRIGLFLAGAIAGNALTDIIIMGFIANSLRKPAIILSTSLIGAFLIYISTKGLLEDYSNLWHRIVYTMLLAIFLIVQFNSSPENLDTRNRYSTPSRYRARY